MTEKRDPTKRHEELRGPEGNDGPPDFPEGVEHGEYVNYRPESGEGHPEAQREASLQPGGAKPAPGGEDRDDDHGEDGADDPGRESADDGGGDRSHRGGEQRTSRRGEQRTSRRGEQRAGERGGKGIETRDEKR